MTLLVPITSGITFTLTLQKEVNDSKSEIIKFMDDKTKEENVKERIKYLTDDSSKFWGNN